MLSDLITSHKKFVIQKAAPFHPVTTEEFELLHLAVGLSTEYLEFMDASTNSHLREELGDLLWYFTYGSLLIPTTSTDLMILYECVPVSPSPRIGYASLSNFACALEELLSAIKKYAIYQQHLDLAPQFIHAWQLFCVVLKVHEVPLDQLIKENQDKLNSRYTDKFTTEESSTRKDKQ